MPGLGDVFYHCDMALFHNSLLARWKQDHETP